MKKPHERKAAPYDFFRFFCLLPCGNPFLFWEVLIFIKNYPVSFDVLTKRRYTTIKTVSIQPIQGGMKS